MSQFAANAWLAGAIIVLLVLSIVFQVVGLF